MKKTHLFAMMLSMAFTVLFCSSVSAAEPEGRYEGWYYASQGQTGLTLTVNEDGTGVFEFYNMPGKSNAKDGSYSVTVSNNGGEYIVEGKDWIDRPSGYSFVSLYGTVDGDTFSGNVDNRDWLFTLIKDTAAYEEVKESVYAGRRYEVIEEEMSWAAAEAYCEERGGHLLTINSAEEQSFIEGLLEKYPDEDYMIGAHRSLGEFSEWVTGEDMTYTNWGEPQPDNINGGQSVGVICNGSRTGASYSIERFQWDDNGDRAYPFICEWDTWSNAAEWSTPELSEAAEHGLIPDTIVGKDMTKPITRGEFAAVSVKLFEAMTNGKAVMSSDCRFGDITENENRNYILKAYNIGAVNGVSDTAYEPDALLQREQLAAMLCRVYKRSEWPEWTLDTDGEYTINYSGVKAFADDALISDYAKPSVYFMVKYDILSGVGDNKFAPKNTTAADEAEHYANATREQAIAMSLRSFKNLND